MYVRITVCNVYVMVQRFANRDITKSHPKLHLLAYVKLEQIKDTDMRFDNTCTCMQINVQ